MSYFSQLKDSVKIVDTLAYQSLYGKEILLLFHYSENGVSVRACIVSVELLLAMKSLSPLLSI